MKINSKRNFKKVLDRMIKAFPFEIPKEYAFIHNENFHLKNRKGIRIIKTSLCEEKRIYLATNPFYYEN